MKTIITILSISLMCVFCDSLNAANEPKMDAIGSLHFAGSPALGTWQAINETYVGPQDVHVGFDSGGREGLSLERPVETVVPVEATVVYEATGGEDVKVTANGFDGHTHYEWTGKFDGNDYPVTGDPNSDTRSYKKLDDHTFELTIKKGGNITITGRVVLFFDGKTCTKTVSGTIPKGSFKITTVYHKQ